MLTFFIFCASPFTPMSRAQRQTISYSSTHSRVSDDRPGGNFSDNNGLFDLHTIQSGKTLESPGQGIENRSSRMAIKQMTHAAMEAESINENAETDLEAAGSSRGSYQVGAVLL